MLDCHLVVLSILPTCEKLFHLIFDRGICVLTLPGMMLKSNLLMASNVQFLLGFSIRLKNLLHLLLLGPNLVQLGLDPRLAGVLSCLVAQHKVTETNDRCIICPQTAPRRLKVSSPKKIAGILTLQLPGLFQHLACFQDIYLDNITLL